MNPSKLVETFQSQLSRYCEIAKDEGLDSGSQGSPSGALAFAEDLLLCPTEGAAIKQMRRDQAEGRAFLQAAKILDDLLPTLDIPNVERSLESAVPFFVLASAVQEYLQKLKKENAENWE